MGNKLTKNSASAAAAASQPEIRVLLVGCGDSGKSTFFRQCEFLFAHHDDASSPDYSLFRPLVREQLIRSLATLLRCAKEVGADIGNTEEMRRTGETVLSMVEANEEQERRVASADPLLGIGAQGTVAVQPLSDKLTPALGSAIARLWADATVRSVFDSMCLVQYEEPLSHFFPEAERVAAPNYAPTRSDVVHLRVPTTGVSETVFATSGVKFRVVDVGGQRNERRKWLRYFDTVDVVVFFENLNEYDLSLYECATRKRLDESLAVWSDICNSPTLSLKPVVLVLNKYDLLSTKVQRVPLKDHVPSFTGAAGDANAATECIRGLFDKVRQDKSLPAALSIVASIIDPSSAESAFCSIRNLFLSSPR